MTDNEGISDTFNTDMLANYIIEMTSPVRIWQFSVTFKRVKKKILLIASLCSH